MNELWLHREIERLKDMWNDLHKDFRVTYTGTTKSLILDEQDRINREIERLEKELNKEDDFDDK